MLNWYLQSGNDSDVVLSTRIRTARNIKGFPFVTRYTKKDALKIIEVVDDKTPYNSSESNLEERKEGVVETNNRRHVLK